MTGLDVLLAVAGLAVTVLVVAGMILITPRGAVDAFDDVTDPQRAERSRADAIDLSHTAARGRRVGPVG
jgi:uncharacterized iron-regulated membrane protein